MKKIWTIVSAFAFLNFMAILAGAGWLLNTGRLDRESIEEIRDVLFASELDGEGELVDPAEIDSESRIADGSPVLSAEQRLNQRLSQSDADQERLQRMQREVDDLKAALSRERRLLDTQRAEFEAERAAFYDQRRTIADLEGGDQFRRSLVVLETMKAGEAMESLQAMLDAGKDIEVVSYLNAMEDRTRSKVFSEWVKNGQPDLAAKLLEDIRQRGIGDLPPGDSSG
ncbi:MAG: hypothetical protein RIB60_05405 [Phycisphaerales bacterium]